jgi:hypothetical protein
MLTNGGKESNNRTLMTRMRRIIADNTERAGVNPPLSASSAFY